MRSLHRRLPRRYRGVADIFRLYWKHYGGAKEVVCSPYLHSAAVLTALLWRLWVEPGWWSIPLSVMPSILGFSLGGYAIWLAIGDERFRTILYGAGPDAGSPFMAVNASFVHFIVLQFAAILAALIFSAWPVSDEANVAAYTKALWGGGFLLFVYALTSALAATMAIFRVASWYERFQTKSRTEGAGRDSSK